MTLKRKGKGPEIEIIPAVDIKGGRCVSLYQGDYQEETVFSDDPVEVALTFHSLGAPRIHVVDLDGAASGSIVNLKIITEIARAVLIPVQVGGGIRSPESIKSLLKAGVERVILSTAAVENPKLVADACRSFRDSIIVAIDARDGYISTHGWQKDTGIPATDFARSMAKLGVKRFIYTDINRNATLSEPNFTAIYELVSKVGLPIIASGGISNLNHLMILQRLGAEAAIVGKALYTGSIDFKQALKALSEMPK